MRHRSLPPRWLLLGVGAPLYSAALVFVRGRPLIRSDAGIWLSVAARLVHGDRLYTGVWDNKPPFFYYADAVALEVGGWRGPFLIDVLWISIASISIWLLLEAAGASVWTRAVGIVVYPLLLTGAWYYAGYSEIPPLALAPVVAWLWLRGNPAATGAVLGVVAFLRPDYAFVFVTLIVAPLVVRAIDRAALRRSALRLLVGFVAAAAASVGVLAVRGELTAYVRTMWANVGYENRALVQIGEPRGVVGHVKVVAVTLGSDRARAALFALVVFTLGVLLIVALRQRARRRSASTRSDSASLSIAFLVGTAVATAVTLALTALWRHNLELIALPATFATCFLVSRLDATVRSRAWRIGAIVGTAAVCMVAFGGLSLHSPSSPEVAFAPLSAWWRTPRSVSAVALDEEAAKVRGQSALVTYARLGHNNDDAHAEFIDKTLKLACPLFHQYPFSSNLDQVLSCIQSRRPELLLVGPSFDALHRPTTQAWDAFVSDSRQLLRARYVEATSMPDDGGKVEVWRRR